MLTCPYSAPRCHIQANFLTNCLPASDSVVILCGDATACLFVSKDAHRAGRYPDFTTGPFIFITDRLHSRREREGSEQPLKKRRSGNDGFY
jgi:hypothetical protein